MVSRMHIFLYFNIPEIRMHLPVDGTLKLPLTTALFFKYL